MNGLIGKKIGMTQVYDANGTHVPVTVISVGPCVVVQRKTKAGEGYDAVQLGLGEQKESRVGKAALGHVKKAGAKPQRELREIRVPLDSALKAGDVVTASVFKDIKYVDVSGVTKGRGFQGVMKRHNMQGGPDAHGSGFHRKIGSIGMREHPGRILKGKRMPGQMGAVSCTTQNLRVVAVREEDNCILVEGAVPGPNGRTVVVNKSIKKA